ncbi:MAG: cation:proton antiporter [Treponema sp.]|jgi:NhaP-type Na+/H+ or K+/H+ antiporter|nr:cation:proton antiporter [Treponema sp.]
MLTSLALIFLSGLLLSSIFVKLKLPGLLGMLISGVILGPYALNLIDGSILNISADLRQLALIIILIRAGLSLNINDLKKVGRPAILLCFVPACFEIAAMIFFAPKILGITILDAAIMGSVVAAVSPAVVVPRMIKLIETRRGTDKSIPQLIMAGASVDDVFVIVLFTSFTSMASGGNISLLYFVNIPLSIVLGVAAGLFFGFVLSMFFKKVHIRDSIKVIILLSTGIMMIMLEHALANKVAFSGLLAVMSVGISMLRFSPVLAERLSAKFSKLWVAAEIILFVLVGATVDINFALAAGGWTIVLLFLVLIFRMIGVFVCLLQTTLNRRERLFCMIAYIPKATVQAAIGGIPLAMGLGCGNIVLTVAVLSILITAPLGALGIDMTCGRFLKQDRNT